jgi:hypothetical protein
MAFLDKGRMMDNVQQHNICIISVAEKPLVVFCPVMFSNTK